MKLNINVFVYQKKVTERSKETFLPQQEAAQSAGFSLQRGFPVDTGPG